ncbi:MAG TPA: ABC transporter ATP-binding protein [Acidimicrobiales bacterium]|nr:ABC transporter ATP-binding protein [Acidimicrobiales bacterium]
MPVLELSNVVKRYGAGPTEVVALDGVSLTVQPGELVAVMGASGSGKSTVLHLAGGLDLPTAGRVLVEGRDLAGLSTTALAAVRRRQVGFVFQRYNLVPALTAVENVLLPLEFDGRPGREARRLAEAALERVGLSRPFDRFPDELSGGEQQRVAVARAVTGDRRLVLADEPTGALDTVTGDLVIELLAGQAAAGTAVVLVTHEPRFASWADRVVFLRDGRVVDESVAPPPATAPANPAAPAGAGSGR